MDVSAVTRSAEEAAVAANDAAARSQAVSEASEPLANQETFLQLLVAQIKNQDPLNPTDSVQFLTQLAQFSELEQLIGIRQDLAGLGDTLAASGDGADEAAPTA